MEALNENSSQNNVQVNTRGIVDNDIEVVTNDVPTESLELFANAKKTKNNLIEEEEEEYSEELEFEPDKLTDKTVNSPFNSLHSRPTPTPEPVRHNSPPQQSNSFGFNFGQQQSEDEAQSVISEISEQSSLEEEPKQMSYEEIQREKQNLLFKLNRLEKAGYKTSRKYTMASNLDDMKYEFNKVKRECDVEKSIKFQRKMLMAFTSGVEFLNNKFDPFDLRLDGWSEHTMDSINEYDDVFEELHDKYNEKIKVAPEVRLLMMVGGSAFMFHLTNSLFKSNMPAFGDILQQNPNLAREFGQATLNSMRQTDPSNPVLNMVNQGMNMGRPQPPPQGTPVSQFTNQPQPATLNRSPQAAPPQARVNLQPRPQDPRMGVSNEQSSMKMKGPPNLDELLGNTQLDDDIKLLTPKKKAPVRRKKKNMNINF
jgi:hypothetical protein